MKKRVEEFLAKIQQKPKRPYTQPPVRAFSAPQAACKNPKQTPNEAVLCLLLASSFLYEDVGNVAFGSILDCMFLAKVANDEVGKIGHLCYRISPLSDGITIGNDNDVCWMPVREFEMVCCNCLMI